MTWANNDPAAKYYQGGQEWRPRQTPIWADPLVAWYSNQPKNAQGTYVDPNWITQGGGTGTGKNAVFTPGFHLSTATPAVTSGNVYSATTTENAYNYGGRAKHGKQTLQVGLDQTGVWRETIAVFPSSAANPFDPAYYPNNPVTVGQGDWDIAFRMTDPQKAASYLQMAVAQGSPFAQFSAENTEAATIVAAYLPGYSQGSGAQAGGITNPVDLNGIRYQIIYQQVNAMDVNAENYPSAMKSNWVSFAVMWDPAKITAKSLAGKTNPADGMTYYSLPLTSSPSYFVVAALPNQMVNNVTPSDAGTPYDPQAADAWARELTRTAFNYFTGKSETSFFAGKKRDGSSAPPNQVNVYYDPNLTNAGPATAGQTTFLLQPHQYSDKFKDGRNGARPLNAEQPFPACQNCGGSKAWTAVDKNKYWIARGKLEAYTDSSLSLTYVMPPVVPYFPSSQLLQEPDRAGAGKNAGINFNINDFAYGLISGQAYPLVVNNPPAGSKLGLGQMNDPYGVGTSLYAAAKLLNALNGLNESAQTPTWYSNAKIQWFKKADMQSALYTQITNLFGYYFSPKICEVGQDGLSSYAYAYYDDASHHLLLYPTGTPGRNAQGQVDGNIGQPQSYSGLQMRVTAQRRGRPMCLPRWQQTESRVSSPPGQTHR
ncbi:MAG: hypothetical protein ACREEM_45995, partial [Blastocatellia bacterium]